VHLLVNPYCKVLPDVPYGLFYGHTYINDATKRTFDKLTERSHTIPC